MVNCNIAHKVSTLLINPIEKTIVINYIKTFNIETGEKFLNVEPHIVLNAEGYNRVAKTEIFYKGYKVTLEDLITQLTLGEVKKENPDVIITVESSLPYELIQEFQKKEGDLNDIKS